MRPLIFRREVEWLPSILGSLPSPDYITLYRPEQGETRLKTFGVAPSEELTEGPVRGTDDEAEADEIVIGFGARHAGDLT